MAVSMFCIHLSCYLVMRVRGTQSDDILYRKLVLRVYQQKIKNPLNKIMQSGTKCRWRYEKAQT
jgi:hypothetical protein